MKTYIVQIKRHCGWYATTAEGETFSEAAIGAVIATSKKFDLDLSEYKVSYKFDVDGEYQRVQVFWEEYHDYMLFGHAKPGDYWFGHLVREGSEEDCEYCGGTGQDYYNFWKQCWSCGDDEIEGKSSGKKADSKEYRNPS